MSEQEKLDREFVYSYAHWNGKRRKYLGNHRKRAIDEALWALQDGYGTPGYTPCQEWDWSGIRDSSPEALHNMAKALEALGYQRQRRKK